MQAYKTTKNLHFKAQEKNLEVGVCWLLLDTRIKSWYMRETIVMVDFIKVSCSRLRQS